MKFIFNKRVLVYLTIIFVIVIVVILSITLTTKSKNNSNNQAKKMNVFQEEVTLYEVENLPPFNKIVYAIVDSYEGYINFPTESTYPKALLDILTEWNVDTSLKSPGKLYLMNKKLAGQDCEWIEFLENQYCQIKNEENE